MGTSQTELQGPDLAAGIPVADLAEGTPLLGHAAGEAVVVVKVGADVHAIAATCTHYGGPLAEGLVVGSTIRCPWHHACFDLRTGANAAPALSALTCWQTERRGDRVHVIGKKPAAAPAPVARGPKSVAIVGAGAAGAACALALRDRGYTGPITMLGGEDPGPVDRPNLSKDYLAGTAPEEWIPLRGDDDWRALGVEVVTDPVVVLDAAARRVTLASGRDLTADAIVLATGAEPVRLPIPGAERIHVHTLRTLADSRAIIAAAASARRATVLGASFLGLEVAASLRARGLEVDVVAPEPIPLGAILGDDLGRAVRAVHEAHGTRFHLGLTATEIRDDTVTLSDRGTLVADLVVMAVGVRPRTALAEAAGLRVDRGIVVDDQLRTSAAGLWACGDVARFPDPLSGDAIRIEHWVVAERQGQAVARNLLGEARPFRDVPFFWSLHHELTINYVGHVSRFDRAQVIGDLAARDAAVVYRRGPRIAAVATIGRDLLCLQVEAAMERGDDAALERLLG